jgi:hypothetical protein
MSSSSVRVTNYPAIKNAPLVGLAEGNGSFNNYHLAALVVVVPYILKSFLPIVKYGGFKTYLFMFLLTGAPTAVGYWAFNSIYGARRNEKVALPGKDIEEYITINDPELKKVYKGKEKMPMQLFHDSYFDGKVDFNGTSVQCHIYRMGTDFSFPISSGDVLEILEQRHDWAKMSFTLELFKYVFTVFIPEVVVHSQSQDEEQVRGHYDRTWRHIAFILFVVFNMAPV